MITKYHVKSKNTLQTQKIQYNYNNINCILELLLAYSVVVDGEFLLKWCEYFGQPQVWYMYPYKGATIDHGFEFVNDIESINLNFSY